MPEKRELLERLSDAFDAEQGTRELVRQALEGANPLDVADILGELDLEAKKRVFESLDQSARAAVIAETDENTREQLVLASPLEAIGALMNRMPPDEAADLLEHIPEDQRESVLGAIDDEHARDVRELDQYPPESAGGIMTTRYHKAFADETVGDVLAHIEAEQEEVEAANRVFVVRRNGELAGVAELNDMMGVDETAPLIDVADREPVSALVSDDQEEVGNLAAHYNLQVVPVVDARGVLVGIVTHDDVVDVIKEEADEDLYRLAGEGFQPLTAPVVQRVAKRLPWLVVTMTGGLLSSFLLSRMNQKGPVVFLLVIVGMAGNVGIQSATLMVRGLATGELNEVSRLRVLIRELLVGVLIGLVCGLLTGTIAYFMQGAEYPNIGLAVGIGMWAGVSVAALMGTVIPLLCDAVSVDPAIAAGPFITTLNDIVGVMLFMNIASALNIKG